jgi:hypothetical protein
MMSTAPAGARDIASGLPAHPGCGRKAASTFPA